MRINEIGMPRGANRKTKRRGRGSGSGHGKTSCRGHKGALARSGTTTRPTFEGGQIPLVRRLPKRGFNPPFPSPHQVVNVESLNRFKKDSVVGPKELKEAGFITTLLKPVKILGDGKLSKALTIKANGFSASAMKKIEEAGAKAEVITEVIEKKKA